MKRPKPQPTESEAIVAALRSPENPKAPLTPPVPSNVDKAAAVPATAPVAPI